MINNIKNNTISEADTKKKINELNEIKKVETKGKRLINSQEKLLRLFDDLKTIFNNNNSNNNESDSNNKNDNENENENDEYYYEIEQLNNWFETIDQTKSLEKQIELLKERGEFLSKYWHVGYYHGNKELNYKIFKAKAAHLLNDLDEQLFEKKFGHTFAALVDKLTNTRDKEENQIIFDNVKNNRDKAFEQDKFGKFVVQQRGDVRDAVKIILEINELLAVNDDNND